MRNSSDPRRAIPEALHRERSPGLAIKRLAIVEETLGGLVELIELLRQDRLNDLKVDSKVFVSDEIP